MTAPTLRPYQAAALDRVRGAMRAGARSVLLVAPTGAGKGTIAAHVLASSAAQGRRSLFLVHRAELVRDIAARVRSAGVSRVAIAMGSETQADDGAMVTVGTVQTLEARGYADSACSLVVVDEAHHATCETYRATVARCPSARVLGLTATPERADGTALGDVFDRLVVAASIRELTEAGHLVPARVIAPAERLRGVAADPVEAVLTHAGERRTIVFASTIAHADRIAVGLIDRGIGAASVSSEESVTSRRATLDAFTRGDLRVLVNVGILTEGYDDPTVSCVVLARGVGHAGAWLQIVGRALRPTAGKADALIVDLAGSVHEHGLPGDDREWSLEGRPIRLGEKEERIRQCAACGSVFRASEYRDAACPACGAVARAKPDPRVVKRALEEQRAAILARGDLSGRVGYLRGQLEDARARGYRDGWAMMRFRERFGRFPSKREREEANGCD